MTLNLNIDRLLKSKYLGLITLIPQLDIVRTQSPFWKPGSVRHIAARGTGASVLAMFHEIGRILWQMFMAAHFRYISLWKIKELLKHNQNPKVYFPPIRIVCPYDVELVTTSKKSWIKVIYWSAATNSKWKSEENVIFLLVYEFRDLLLRFDWENRRKRQHCDHRSLFPSPSRITSPLLWRLECVAWRIVASHCDVLTPSLHWIDHATIIIKYQSWLTTQT